MTKASTKEILIKKYYKWKFYPQMSIKPHETLFRFENLV